ncbi:hypothetical protein ACFL2V_18290, partial [Pseudomonadota bacterium]
MPVDREPLGPPVTLLALVLIDKEPQSQQAKCRASSVGLRTTAASLMLGVRSCVRPATQASVLDANRLKQKGRKRLTVPGYLPLCIPPGGSEAVPCNITRHCAKCPHARTSHRSAATSHNTALCVNGPEGRPQTP